ncbi:hypothetical protein ACS5PK_08720 [Roseateles sp. DB2]|uniref:hypothetical protein n=1 Tax=Roseateles sp. DB2 TaxID=3453717 RepID=UPI003EE8D6C2
MKPVPIFIRALQATAGLSAMLMVCSGAQAQHRSGPEVQWQHRLRMDLSTPVRAEGAQEQRGQWLSQLQWQGEPQAGPLPQSARLELALQARTGAAGFAEARIGEAWLQWQHGAWQARLGRQHLAWAVTDTVSPLDALQMRDWRTLHDPQRRPLAALLLHREAAQADGLSWDLVLADGRTRALLPNGPWQSPLPSGLHLEEARHGERPVAVALRAQHRVGDTEFSWLAYRGHSQAPAARLQVGDGMPRLQPFHDRLDLLGLGLVSPVAEASLLRLELVRHRQRQAPDFTQLVLSLDHEFYDLLGRGSSLYGLVQGQWSRVGHPGAGVLPDWPDLRRVLDQRLLTRWDYRPDDSGRWQAGIEAVLALGRTAGGREHLLKLRSSWRLGSGAEMEAWALLMGGAPDSFWGRHAGQDRLGLSLRWSQ